MPPLARIDTNGSLPAVSRRNKYIKDPGLDPVIAMQRLRKARGLDVDAQKRSVSGISCVPPTSNSANASAAFAILRICRFCLQPHLALALPSRLLDLSRGAVLHKHLELTHLEKEIKMIEDGVQEYQNYIDLHEKDKEAIRKSQEEDRHWCATFDRVIGPFEAKYEECQKEVVAMAMHGREVYQKSYQKLIDEFGYHPAFKRWFDEF